MLQFVSLVLGVDLGLELVLELTLQGLRLVAVLHLQALDACSLVAELLADGLTPLLLPQLVLHLLLDDIVPEGIFLVAFLGAEAGEIVGDLVSQTAHVDVQLGARHGRIHCQLVFGDNFSALIYGHGVVGR